MRDTTRIDWHRRVDAAVRRLHASLDDPVCFTQIADEVASSPYHFHRMFRALTGETVARCLKRLRLERAAYQIDRTRLDVTEVAFEAGFETLEAFSKAFKREFGVRPSDLRALRTWNGRLPSSAGIHFEPDGHEGWFFIGETENAMEVKIVALPGQRFYAMRNIGDYWQLPEKWQALVRHVVEAGYKMPPKQAMILFHDHGDGVPMEGRRSDVAVIADQEIPVAGELFVEETPGGTYAITPHFGSHEEIGLTWDRWRSEWLPTSGWRHDATRPSLEWYQNDASIVPPELLLTFLCDPVTRD